MTIYNLLLVLLFSLSLILDMNDSLIHKPILNWLRKIHTQNVNFDKLHELNKLHGERGWSVGTHKSTLSMHFLINFDTIFCQKNAPKENNFLPFIF